MVPDLLGFFEKKKSFLATYQPDENHDLIDRIKMLGPYKDILNAIFYMQFRRMT